LLSDCFSVVIPWRGFRCFTPTGVPRYCLATNRVVVVIPWRGFRCFTPTYVPSYETLLRGCNPLAGI